MRKIAFGTLIVIGGFVVGFIFLLRGCLSKYDERAAIGPSYYFEKNGRGVIFSLVKFEKATSYSSGRGITHKTVNTSYFIQCNDALTGARIDDRKIKKHKEVKNYPIELMGASDGTAWAFIGELMAFDPFSLEKIADVQSLEASNPNLKGKFPAEQRYYKFDDTDKSIEITAIDGSLWKLDTRSMRITATGAKKDDDETTPSVAALEKQLKQLETDLDSLMEQKFRRPSRLVSARQITMNQYNTMIQGFNKDRSVLYAKRDSLQSLLNIESKLASAQKELIKNIRNLQGKMNINYSQIRSNMDTVDRKWYGLYTAGEIEKLYARVQFQGMYGDAARRMYYQSNFKRDNSGDYIVIKADKKELPITTPFLDGGFLMAKSTGRPIVLTSPQSHLVVSKTQIGNEGKIVVSRLTLEGKTIWSFDTRLKEWGDWFVTKTHLYVFGTDNRELSNSDINVLYCIDLSTGKVSTYDYFDDELRS